VQVARLPLGVSDGRAEPGGAPRITREAAAAAHAAGYALGAWGVNRFPAGAAVVDTNALGGLGVLRAVRCHGGGLALTMAWGASVVAPAYGGSADVAAAYGGALERTTGYHGMVAPAARYGGSVEGCGDG
jgi:hypothetical protein